ncbi:unnamed protein product [Rotaria magnacalcarata]|uniref:Uncharacterized protein n=2 Tax=Rotaria magnacalcarata TaxID=392030 RepID=A0A815HA21_9BILA|nr:unnamed protein product [Rotaria magnacalcarata]CAF2092099.1 unnamed protein product [Rotaria magnacalcarata]CAF3914713.1 unnamed protein product [Rotaria magnacalcarata]CAF3924103.1 unnamed protein product [Rotaria magnacalcarata]
MSISKVHIIVFLVVSWSSYILSYVQPHVEMKRLSAKPIISSWNKNSDFLYNYNSAFMPMINDPNAITLLVRVQDLLNDAENIYNVGPSKIAVTQSIDRNPLSYSHITQQSVIIDIDQVYQSLGAEDPRVVLFNGSYYLFYTAVSKVLNGDWRAQLALATCKTECLTKEGWTYHGPLFPDEFWCKSGSLLIHNDTHRYLFFNDSNIAIAQTTDLINYSLTSSVLLSTRSGSFDSELVEAGPEPLKLSDNNYLFLYNSARRTNVSNPKPGWSLEYNLGWAILNGDNPTEVLARSDRPIFSPVLDWEKCDNTSSEWTNRGLTPLVIFVEGWKKTAPNTFLVWYQGCDSAMGLAELKVYFSSIARANICTPLVVYMLTFFSFMFLFS